MVQALTFFNPRHGYVVGLACVLNICLHLLSIEQVFVCDLCFHFVFELIDFSYVSFIINCVLVVFLPISPTDFIGFVGWILSMCPFLPAKLSTGLVGMLRKGGEGLLALKSGKVGAAAVDVYRKEPPGPDNPLIGLPNVLLLPHMGSSTIEGRTEMGEKVIINIKTFADGHRPPDRVIPAIL